MQRKPYSNKHNSVIKHCVECGTLLKLNNSRDIERKKFCSHSCRGKLNGRNVDMGVLWAKSNTPEANAKKAHCGENHPKWIVDRTKVKRKLRPELTTWRNAVFERDDYTCQECNCRGGKLHAHHKAPFSIFKKLRYEVFNGITVCVECHKELHKTVTELFGGLTSKENQQRGIYFAN